MNAIVPLYIINKKMQYNSKANYLISTGAVNQLYGFLFIYFTL